MNFLFTALNLTRSNAWKAIEHLSKEQLYTIPDKFNNNIAWNLAHMVASQQVLCYKLAGVNPLIPEDFIQRNKKETSPKNWEAPERIDLIKEYFELTSARFEEDFKAGKFTTYKEYTTSAGVTLRNIQDAIAYNYGHENLHYGTILSLRKLV